MGKLQIMTVAVVFVMVFSFTFGFYTTAMADDPEEEACCELSDPYELGVYHKCGAKGPDDWICDCRGFVFGQNCDRFSNPNNCPLYCHEAP